MSRKITTVIRRLAIVHAELSPTGPPVEREHARIPSEVVVETKFQVECLLLGFCGKLVTAYMANYSNYPVSKRQNCVEWQANLVMNKNSAILNTKIQPTPRVYSTTEFVNANRRIFSYQPRSGPAIESLSWV